MDLLSYNKSGITGIFPAPVAINMPALRKLMIIGSPSPISTMIIRFFCKIITRDM